MSLDVQWMLCVPWSEEMSEDRGKRLAKILTRAWPKYRKDWFFSDGELRAPVAAVVEKV